MCVEGVRRRCESKVWVAARTRAGAPSRRSRRRGSAAGGRASARARAGARRAADAAAPPRSTSAASRPQRAPASPRAATRLEERRGEARVSSWARDRARARCGGAAAAARLRGARARASRGRRAAGATRATLCWRRAAATRGRWSVTMQSRMHSHCMRVAFACAPTLACTVQIALAWYYTLHPKSHPISTSMFYWFWLPELIPKSIESTNKSTSNQDRIPSPCFMEMRSNMTPKSVKN